VPAPLAGEPRGATGFALILGLPAREAVSEADWRVGVPVGSFLENGTKAQPLSHGCAVPAPLAGEPRGAMGFALILGLPAREAVSEADWRVGVLVGSFLENGTKAQSLSHGCAVPAPLAGEPRGATRFTVILGLPAREAVSEADWE